MMMMMMIIIIDPVKSNVTLTQLLKGLQVAQGRGLMTHYVSTISYVQPCLNKTTALHQTVENVQTVRRGGGGGGGFNMDRCNAVA